MKFKKFLFLVTSCGMQDFSFWTRDQTRPGNKLVSPGVGAWGLNYWTTREVPKQNINVFERTRLNVMT